MHVGLITWMIFKGAFTAEPLPLEVAEVSIVTSQEYTAILAAQRPPDAGTELAALTPPETAIQDPPQEPNQVEDAAPDRTDPAEARLDAPEPDQPDPPEPLATPAEPPQTSVDDTAPDITAPDTETVALVAPPEAPRPPERPTERLAPRPSPPPPADARPDTIDQAPVSPEAEAPPAPEADTATAPPEANETAAVEPPASAAPSQSLRPPKRPTRPSRAAAQPTTSQPSAQRDQAVDAAVAAALSNLESSSPGAQTGPTGPPMTGGEKEALRVAVSQCWNVGSLSSAALETTVTVSVDMTPDAKPVSNSIRLIGFSGGDDAAAKQAFDAARRAIIRCGGQGYDLPPEKYDHWREIEMTFNPEKMQYR